MIKIVTDSGSGVTPEVAKQYSITVVPLYVHFGTEVFREGLDIQLPEFLSRLKASPQLPTTSQPSAGDAQPTVFGQERNGGLIAVA